VNPHRPTWVIWFSVLAAGVIFLFVASWIEAGRLVATRNLPYEIFLGIGISFIVVAVSEMLLRSINRPREPFRSATTEEFQVIVSKVVESANFRIIYFPGWNILSLGAETYGVRSIQTEEGKLHNLVLEKARQSAHTGRPMFWTSYRRTPTLEEAKARKRQPGFDLEPVRQGVQQLIDWSNRQKYPRSGLEFRVAPDVKEGPAFRFVVGDNNCVIWAAPGGDRSRLKYCVIVAEEQPELANALEAQFHELRAKEGDGERALAHHGC
jgi:hypothetical protein